MSPRTTALFAEASRLHQEGSWSRAEELYRAILALEPGHSDALHMFGWLAHQNHRNDIAVDLIDRAIARDPRRAPFHNSLGSALLALGRSAEAVAAYRKALTLAPASIEIRNNLGLAFQAEGRLQEAASLYRAVLSADPKNPDVQYNLGCVLQLLGEVDEAISHFQAAAAGKPFDALILNDLGNALCSRGEYLKAVKIYKHALTFAPDLADIYKNLGAALHLAGHLNEAEASLRAALALSPDDAAIHDTLGYTHHHQGRLVEALEDYDRAIALNPNNPDIHNNRGFALEEAGRLLEASAAYGHALVLEPDYAPALNNLGNLRKDAGDFAAAADLYRKAITADPYYTRSHSNLAELEQFTADGTDMAELERLAKLIAAVDPRLPPARALHVHFALGKALADSGRHDEAFAHFQRGNAIKRRVVAYDRGAMTAYMRSIAETFSAGRLARHDRKSNDGADCIFIVGMPRSGTTLLEQILSSHSLVHAVGEPTAFDEAAKVVLGASAMPLDFAAHISQVDAKALDSISAGYRRRLPLPPGKTHRVDKLPGNFLNIGLIRMALPGAIIVHATRDPVDTCVSCFTKLFRRWQHFTYDLTDLGQYARDYLDLMQHWRTVLPDEAVLDIAYEKVVADLEKEVRRMLVYCGLPWEARCLEFHRTQRTIATASALQVRQPIYTTALARARPYDAYLAPLRKALADRA